MYRNLTLESVRGKVVFMYRFICYKSFGDFKNKDAISPNAKNGTNVSIANGREYISARRPTIGATRPPIVWLTPSVMPEAKPMLLAKYVWPNTIVGL